MKGKNMKPTAKNDAEKPIYIYTIQDPTTKEVRYVGATVNPQWRFSIHRSRGDSRFHPGYGTNPRMSRWIDELRASDHEPLIEIVATIILTPRFSPSIVKKTVEKIAIFYFRKGGSRLFNRAFNRCPIEE
jgi:hypothetical protein